MTSAPPDLSKKQQRKASKRDNDEFSREMAVVRAQQKRRRTIRNRIIAAVAIVVAVALVAGGVGFLLWKKADDALAGPANMHSDGIVLTFDSSTSKVAVTKTAALKPHELPTVTDEKTVSTSGVLPIDLYLDYGQPASAAFGKANLSNLSTWLSSGIVSLEFHPVALSSAHGHYSARAANAMACVAASAPTQFLTASTALLTAAAAKGFSYPQASGIVTILKKAKVSSAAISSCITGGTYAGWVTAATARAKAGTLPNSKVKLTAAPVILADGSRYTGKAADATAFETFASTIGQDLELAAQQSAAASGSGSTGTGG